MALAFGGNASRRSKPHPRDAGEGFVQGRGDESRSSRSARGPRGAGGQSGGAMAGAGACLGGLYFLSLRGDVLIARGFRDDAGTPRPQDICAAFRETAFGMRARRCSSWMSAAIKPICD